MINKSRITRVLLLISLGSCFAQRVDSSFQKNPEELSSLDSLTIFQLIDSLMTMEEIESSQLVARLGYNSNVLSAGRTLGISEFGLSPAISYYHKSGLFADVTTYWSNDIDPSHYLTTASAGYMHLFSAKFSAIASYDHYFYHQTNQDFVAYKNTITVSPAFDVKNFTFRLDYSFYFGDAYANRIMPGVSFTFKKKNFWGIDRISVYPSAYLLLGDETLTELELIAPANLRELVYNLQTYNMRFRPVLHEKNVFGIMNYAFSLPVNVAVKNWLFNISYTYSIPKALEGEPLVMEDTGFISAGITYYIHLKPVKIGL